MRYLIISILIFLLSSCSLATTKNLVKYNSDIIIENAYFSDTNIDYIYKAKITAGKNNFGGILIIKKIKKNHHRVVFTTEFGNKIFDFEFVKQKFKVNYIVDKLNRKIIVKALRKDFHLLVNEYNPSIEKFIKPKQLIYKTRLNKKDNYYHLKKDNKQLSKIIRASKRKEKMTIHFNDVTNGIANNIKLKHHNFKMTIQLNYINY